MSALQLATITDDGAQADNGGFVSNLAGFFDGVVDSMKVAIGIQDHNQGDIVN